MVCGFFRYRKVMKDKKEYPYNIEFGNGRTKEERDKMQKELGIFLEELNELASHVVKDFKENPTDISGSTIQIHEDSPYLNENLPDKGWHRMIKTKIK